VIPSVKSTRTSPTANPAGMVGLIHRLADDSDPEAPWDFKTEVVAPAWQRMPVGRPALASRISEGMRRECDAQATVMNISSRRRSGRHVRVRRREKAPGIAGHVRERPDVGAKHVCDERG